MPWSASIHGTIHVEWWSRYCSPTCCTGANNAQVMLDTWSINSMAYYSYCCMLILIAVSHNYACNWHTASYLYSWACCPTAMNLLIGATAFLGQTVDHMHTHIYRQISHSQMPPQGKVMCIICLVAPLPPQSKYKHDSQQVMALTLTQDGGIPLVVLYEVWQVLFPPPVWYMSVFLSLVGSFKFTYSSYTLRKTLKFYSMSMKDW